MKKVVTTLSIVNFIVLFTHGQGITENKFDFLKIPNTLNEAIFYEKELRSKDVSYDHFVGIGEGLYPNKRHYNLTTVKTFSRKDSSLDYSVDYYSSDDDSIRVVLYEWKNSIISPQEENLFASDTVFMDTPRGKVVALDAKFSELQKALTAALAKPTFKRIHSKVSSETKRDDLKWEYPGKPNVYLLMFKHKGYREIRMTVYLD
jgi:hypothetical protein